MALLSTPPNTRRSQINNLTVSSKDTPRAVSSYPSISHSNVSESAFTNLTSSSRISHSSLDHVEVSLSSQTGTGTSSQCHGTRDATAIKHSSIESSSLTNVGRVNHFKATSSALSNLCSVSRTSIERSSVTGDKDGGETIKRADIRDSTLTGTEIRRCKLYSVRAERSKLHRAVLKDCDVVDCVILRTELKGMRLRNGVWKNGRLIGSVGGGEVTAVSLVGFHFSFLDLV